MLSKDFAVVKFILQEACCCILFQACSRHVPDMFQTCSRHVPGMFQACSRCVPGVFQACSRHIPGRGLKILFYAKVPNLIGFWVSMLLHKGSTLKSWKFLTNFLTKKISIVIILKVFIHVQVSSPNSFQVSRMLKKGSALWSWFFTVDVLTKKSCVWWIYFYARFTCMSKNRF